MVRDSQRQKVYDWEAEIGLFEYVQEPFMDKEECFTLVQFIWENVVGKKDCPIFMSYKPKRSRGTCRYLSNGYINIIMNDNTTKREQLVHEVAHALLYHFTDYSLLAGHGPEWLGVYIFLLSRYCDLNMGELLKSAYSHSLKILPISKESDIKKYFVRGLL